jgi:hypothetical protein
MSLTVHFVVAHPLLIAATTQLSFERRKQMKLVQIGSVAGLMALVGCAHGTMRGSVAMKASEDEAHVCLGDNEVKTGDTVSFFKSVCARSGKGESGGNCRKEKLGEGIIERTLNHHYSVAKVNPGVTFEEGTIVEKN